MPPQKILRGADGHSTPRPMPRRAAATSVGVMVVKVGAPAPLVAADAYVRGGESPVHVELAGYRGQWVVVVFYRRDFSVVCPDELQTFAELADDFAQEQAQLLAVSTDSWWSHRAWFESDPRLAGVRFPVLADTTHDVAHSYDVLGPDGSALRGTFVVDPAGVLRHASVSDESVARSAAETLRVLRALRASRRADEELRAA
jgi:peroxiredoxin (alkyl hydroperoxide reductase subunit C)